MTIGVIGWIVLGVITGFITSKLANRRNEGLPFDILLGVLGAVLGGWLFNGAGAPGMTGFNVWSLLAAVIGAAVLLVVWHTLRRTVRHA